MKRLAFVGLLLVSACSAQSAGGLQTSASKPGPSSEMAAAAGMPVGGTGKTPDRADAFAAVAQVEASSLPQPPTNEAKATGTARRVATAAGQRPGKEAPSGDAAVIQAATVQAVLQAMAQRDVVYFCLYRLTSGDAARDKTDAAATTSACADLIRAYARSIAADDPQSASVTLPPSPAIPETALPAP